MRYFPDKLTIKWIKASYKEGALTPLDLVKEIIRRSESTKDKNIWITPPSLELTMPYIKALEFKSNEECPLWGIPFAIKDNIDLEQVETTAGCKAYGYLPTQSATVVEKLVQAGGIPVGKTNLDQFATGLVGTRSPYGEVHNALDDTLISGGSSSGSAVSVALGMASFSLGTDTAGSGRVPAALNGLIGYKPPIGAWSTRGVVPACASLDCVTVFANTLEEVELVNKVARGMDDLCEWSKAYSVPEEILPKRICLPKKELTFYGPFKETYKREWDSVVDSIKELGIKVEFIDYSIFEEAAAILYEGPWVAERWSDLGEFVKEHGASIFPVTKTILESGNKEQNTAEALFCVLHKLKRYRKKVQQLLGNAVLVMPTSGGTFTRDEVRKDPIKTNSQMGLYTNHCNLLDLCAVAVPKQVTNKQLPFGITIFGLADAESLVLGMARAFLDAASIRLAVCGLHKKGYALESQLVELGAKYIGKSQTASCYKLYELETVPIKPGLVHKLEGGDSIELELYDVPKSQFGTFISKVKEPLSIGTITLQNGEKVLGFLSEEYVTSIARDITDRGKFEE